MAFNQKQAGYLKDYINLEIKDAEKQIKQMNLKLKEKKLNSNRVRKKQENTRNIIEQKQFESEQQQKNKFNEEEFNYGEKKKSIHITKTYNVFWTQVKDDDNWKPESREGGSLVQQDRFLVLYGGIGKQFLDQVAYFDLMRFQWEKKTNPQIGEVQPDKGRRGMTTNIHKDKIIYFGGEKRYNDQLKIRQCYLDFKQYDFGKNQWSVLKLDQFSSMVIARRDHCTVNISSKYLFYYGGIDSNGKYITEPQILNLETLKNYNVELQVAQKSKAKIMPVAYFTMKAIFKSEFTLEKIYTPIQFKKYSIKQPVKEEGIYIFGGKNENGKANNYLHIIKPGQAPYIYDRLVPEGQPPEARYGHSMDYCHSLNSLVIYGGCNEDSSNVYFNDVHILDLQYLLWCKVEVQGPQFSGRAMHCSTLVDDKIFIFGGIQIK
ncbi:hypothetical protein PPERSA_05445 [Pseudocohnilembus persalinus]|uniref:Galactose oxidase/kelch, beta-propeller n=1 Tax=Pseudocohnilembus persalinus TaxID=266149 RepID=A0A0V0R806_PSEPJ|nr:hypothetical protein PPERSA_05445 [Pseudocohnilembus persalinus]|eukprot:KRX10625.1 hypothetical protein PPERSA_05445 [Pseudocohnilembus persalinus]